jgi:signal transduction histidine kinase
LGELTLALESLGSKDALTEGLRAAHEAAQRVCTIVSDLRTFSSGAAVDKMVPIDLRHSLDTALRMALPQTRTKAVINLEMETLPAVLANEGRMVQVFLNLLVNAAQAIPEGVAPQLNTITVRATREKSGGVQVQIIDTGSGMSAEVRARLFTPFFTTKPIGTGTGLGLSICHKLISNAGGVLDCNSTLGVGTTFRIWLPEAQ